MDVVCGLVLVARTQKGQGRMEAQARWLLREFSLTLPHFRPSCPPPPPAPSLDADLSLELEQLREERNRLDAELQLSAHLIQQEVGRAREQGMAALVGGWAGEDLGSEAQVPRSFLSGEAERRQLNEVAQQLEQELRCAQESLASVGQQLEAARQGQQESTEEAANLRQELTQQQKIYGQGGQPAWPCALPFRTGSS